MNTKTRKQKESDLIAIQNGSTTNINGDVNINHIHVTIVESRAAKAIHAIKEKAHNIVANVQQMLKVPEPIVEAIPETVTEPEADVIVWDQQTITINPETYSRNAQHTIQQAMHRSIRRH